MNHHNRIDLTGISDRVDILEIRGRFVENDILKNIPLNEREKRWKFILNEQSNSEIASIKLFSISLQEVYFDKNSSFIKECSAQTFKVLAMESIDAINKAKKNFVSTLNTPKSEIKFKLISCELIDIVDIC